MSKLDTVIGSIRELPELERESGLVATLKAYKVKVEAAKTELERAAQTARWIRDIFPDLDLRRAEAAIQQAARRAGRLQDVFTGVGTGVLPANTDEGVIVISQAANSSWNAVKTNWSNYIASKSEAYGGLVEAVRKAGLDPTGELASVLQRLRSCQNNPPQTAEEADLALSAVEGISQFLLKGGLAGPVGDFLVAAASGSADPRALDDADVRKFVEDHSLWHLLKVRLV